MGNLYRFVEPVVLHLLERKGAAYGYDLAGDVQNHALTDSQIDRGALYRTLQRLESVGHVTSSWDVGGSGPARHIYRISDSGRRHLREWVVVLENLAESMKAFASEVRSLAPE